MLFLLTSLSKLPSRRGRGRWAGGGGGGGGGKDKHNYLGGFVLINCQILRTDGKENPQLLVKRITCQNFGLKVHSNLKAFR